MNRKKRVLLVGLYPADEQIHGGQAKFIANFLDSKLSQTFEVIPFKINRPNKPLVLNNTGYAAFLNAGYRRAITAVIITVYNFLRFPFCLVVRLPDIVQIQTSDYFNFWENAYYTVVAWLLRRKILIRFGGSSFDVFYTRSPAAVRFLIRMVLKMPNKIIVQAEYWQRFFKTMVAPARLVVLPNTVDWRWFTRAGLANNLDQAVNVLFLGSNQAKRKGVFDLLKAIPLVLAQQPAVMFTLVVPNEEIRKLCTKMDLDKNIVLKDWVFGEEKLKTFTSADIYALPSYGEGFPNTLLEAMATGLAVVATDVGAIPEIIENGKNGYIVHPGDYRSLATRLIDLVVDEQLRRAMGQRNKKKVKAAYDSDKVFSKLATEYKQLLAC